MRKERTNVSFVKEIQDGVQTLDTRDGQKQNKRKNESTVEVDDTPSAVEAAPCPEMRGKCARTATRPYSAGAMAPVA